LSTSRSASESINSFSGRWLAEIPGALFVLRLLVAAAELNVSLFLFSNSEFDFSRQVVDHPKKEAVTLRIYNNVFNRRLLGRMQLII
jgi:hypothetical protein